MACIYVISKGQMGAGSPAEFFVNFRKVRIWTPRKKKLGGLGRFFFDKNVLSHDLYDVLKYFSLMYSLSGH